MNAVTPEVMGFSGERLARIGQVMQGYVDDGKLAGMVPLIARRDSVVYCGSFGMADIEADRVMRTDTIFRIYSMTKPITSIAVLMLFEEGRLRLTDPVARYIPAFEGAKVMGETAPAPPITIHDLLTHTAGLSYGYDELDPLDQRYRKDVWDVRAANPDMTLAEFVNLIAGLPLAHAPGTRFRYSLATDVLGYLVEVVSGLPFAEFLKRRVFEPLGMVDTDFFVPSEKAARFAANYGTDPERGLKVIDALGAYTYLQPHQCPSGGGGLVSTMADYLKFARLLLGRGQVDGVRLLGRKTVELMTLNHLPAGVHPFWNAAAGFGLGVRVLLNVARSRNLGSVGNFGWSGAANTHFWVDPQEELIGILMLQFMPADTYPVTAQFQTLTYQALVD